jgi:5'-nucleotidase
VRQATGEPWENVPPYVIKTVTGKDGGSIRVGFVGVTLPSNGAGYVSYLDPFSQIQAQVSELADQTDVIVAVTHLPIADDQSLAANIPAIDLILGGHEHENIQQWRGNDFTPIFKADANARTVYIHRLAYDTEQHLLTINSHLQPVTAAIAPDPDIARVVEAWQQKAFAGFRADGFEPEAIVTQTMQPLDGLESSVRNHPTALTQLIADGLFNATTDVDLAVFNSGSIRIDDVLPAGAIAQYDVIRILPFGGEVVTVNMKGTLLKRVLDQGVLNRGTGGYLQTSHVTQDAETQTWLIGDRPLDPTQTYRVATVDFLISGREQGLDFLSADNPELEVLATHGDVRFALIQELQREN